MVSLRGAKAKPGELANRTAGGEDAVIAEDGRPPRG